MNILQNLIYILFFIQIIRWLITLIIIARMSPLRQKRVSVTVSTGLIDNVLWIAPVIYFSGGFNV
jgi:hypothetical protein